MQRFSIAAVLFLLLPAAFAQAPTIDKAEMEAYLRHLEMWVPQVNVAIDDPVPVESLPGYSDLTVHLSYNGQSQDQYYIMANDGSAIFKGQGYPMEGNPFQVYLDKITTNQAPSFGPDSAPIKIEVFGDFQCPYCKAEAQTMRSNLVPVFGDQVQVFFKDFPLESIHPWARAAAISGRCVYDMNGGKNEEPFWNFHDWIYGAQERLTAASLNGEVMQWAADNGVDSEALSACMENKTSEPAVNANIAEARELGITSTPTIFINGRMLPGALEWPVLEQLLQLELEHLGLGTAEGAE